MIVERRSSSSALGRDAGGRDLAGAAVRRERRRHPRAPRPGALHHQPLLGQAATRWPRPRPAAAPTVTLVTSSPLALPADVAGGSPGSTSRRRPTWRRRCGAAADGADVVVMAAAVADFRPKAAAAHEALQGGRHPRARARADARHPRRAGRAAPARPGAGGFRRRDRRRRSSGGRRKLERKGVDLLVVNDVSAPGVGLRPRHQRRDHPRAPTGASIEVPLTSKDAVANAVLDSVIAHLDAEAEQHVRNDTSPRSRSPRATPTRWRTRSPTPSSTPSSRATRSSRVACETLLTTGLVVVAGEITTDDVRRHPRARARDDLRHRLRQRRATASTARPAACMVALDAQSPDIAQGVDAALELRTGTGGEDHAQRPGRRRPGDDVRLRLRRDARPHAAADLAGPPPRPSAWPRCAGPARCPTCGPTARPRSRVRLRGRPPGAHRHRADLDPARSRASTSRTLLRPDLQRARDHTRCCPTDLDTERLRMLRQPDRASSSSAARTPTPASPGARSSSTPTAAWPATAAAPSRARTPRRSTARPPTPPAGWPSTSSPPAPPSAARSRWPTPSAWPTRSRCWSRRSAPRRSTPSKIADGRATSCSTCARPPSSATSTCAGRSTADGGLRPLRPLRQGVHLGGHAPGRRPAGRARALSARRAPLRERRRGAVPPTRRCTAADGHRRERCACAPRWRRWPRPSTTPCPTVGADDVGSAPGCRVPLHGRTRPRLGGRRTPSPTPPERAPSSCR